MKPLEEIYKDSFFRKRESLAWRAKHVCDAVDEVLKPASVIDVGCAVGDLVREFLLRGVTAYGVEGSIAAFDHLLVENRVFYQDLRQRFNINMVFDLVMCLEVMEHVEEEYSNQLVDNLIRLSSRVLISAAPPGQGGHHHVNCQPKSYWEKKFKEFGYQSFQEKADKICRLLAPWRNKPGIKAYYQNLMYFEEKDACTR